MKSTLLNMVAVLFCITLVASAGVGYVNMITVEPIAEANRKAETAALEAVLPAFDASTAQTVTLDDMDIVVNTATKEGSTVGYAVKTLSKKGFGGMITLMVGFDAEGNVHNVAVLSQAETPGLGTKMADEGNALITSVRGKNPGAMNLSVKKDGGDVDALTAATISSRAYVDAVARAYNAYKQVADGVAGDARTGATKTAEAVENADAAEAGAVQEGGNNE